MVMAGQFLERPALVVAGELTLEAMAHRGHRAPPLIICPPTPEEGGSMDLAVLGEIAFAASKAGHPTLRFNGRGVGASQGTRHGDDDDLADALAAADLLAANTGSPTLAVCGFGRGGNTALRLASALSESRGPKAELVVTVSPIGLDLERCRRLTVPILFIIGDQDVSIDRSSIAIHCQSTGDRLTVIPEGDRLFTRGLPEVGKAIVEFLALRGIG